MLQFRKSIEVNDGRTLTQAYAEKRNGKQMTGIVFVAPTGTRDRIS